MSLRDALTRERQDPRVKCGVRDWLATLPTDEQEAAAELLATSRTTAALFEDFREEGFPLQYNSLLQHRNGKCSCVAR